MRPFSLCVYVRQCVRVPERCCLCDCLRARTRVGTTFFSNQENYFSVIYFLKITINAKIHDEKGINMLKPG